MDAQLFSDGLVSVIEEISRSVVRVMGRRGYPLSGTVWADGLVVTTSRAVERAEGIRLGLPDGNVVDAVLVGRDTQHDLALLKVDAPLAVPDWLEPEAIRVGQMVVRLGRPHKDVQATLGIVSAVSNGSRGFMRGQVSQAVFTDAAPFPGFSGGPLVSLSGNIVGLNSSAISRDQAATLPKPLIERVAKDLLEVGHVRRAYLGLTGQPIRLPAELAEQLGQRVGLMLMSVETGSPAAAAGLALGDTLLRLGDVKVHHPGHLMSVLETLAIDESIALTILRGGQELKLTVTPGEKQAS